jgi:hypothetical protein
MKILLCAPPREPMKAEVPDKTDLRPGHNYVTASIEAAWAWCRFTGSGPVTATEEDGTRIATVSLEIHDE